MSDYEHVVIGKDAMKRLRLFSSRYEIPMKCIVEWFIYTLIDEDGRPQIYGFREAVNEIISDEKIKEKIREFTQNQ